VNGIPAQDLPENQDPDVRHTVLHATGQKIELNEKGEPAVKLGSNGFPVEGEEKSDKVEPAAGREKNMPKAKNFSPQAKKDQNLDGHGDEK
jgi:hypothetical protein